MRFFALEGIDGCGKTTAATLLDVKLHQAGYPHTLRVHDPGGTLAGEALRKLLKDKAIPINGPVGALIVTASKCQLLSEVIEPVTLAYPDVIIIADRWWPSTFAYRYWLDEKIIEQLLPFCPLQPELYIWLDVPLGIGRGRLASVMKQSDRFESEGSTFYKRVHEKYQSMYQRNFLAPWRRVDATGFAVDVAKQVWSIVKEQLNERA